MAQVVIRNGCFFLLGSVSVSIDGQLLRLKPNQHAVVDVPEGNVAIEVHQYWASGKRCLNIASHNADIVVYRRVDERIYLLALGLLIALYTLYFISAIGHLIPTIYTIVIVLLNGCNSLIRSDSYFRIKQP